jgi:hypothetical protein
MFWDAARLKGSHQVASARRGDAARTLFVSPPGDGLKYAPAWHIMGARLGGMRASTSRSGFPGRSGSPTA